MTLEIKDSNYSEIITDNKLLIIDFWAIWCGPCRNLSPIIDNVAKEFEGKVNVGKCDVTENSIIPDKFAIRNIPTIVFVKNDEVLHRMVGVHTESEIKEKINELLNENI